MAANRRVSSVLTIVQANGGEVLLVEKYADVKIVDHARKEALPGTCVTALRSMRLRSTRHSPDNKM